MTSCRKMEEGYRRKLPSSEMRHFIEDVGKYPCLYDKTSKKYKDSVLKAAVWKAISAKYRLFDAEKTWRVQRDRYNRERKKIKESEISGAEVVSLYTPSWVLYSQMDNIFRNCKNQTESLLLSMESCGNEAVSELDCSSTQGSVLREISILPECSEIEFSDERESSLDVEVQPSTSTMNVSCSVSAFSRQQSKNDREEGGQSDLNSALCSFPKSLQPATGCCSQEPVQNKGSRIELFCDLLKVRLQALDAKDAFTAMKDIEIMMLSKEEQEKYFS